MNSLSRHFVRHALLACTASVALGLLAGQSAHAAAITWTGGNGDATNAANWSTQTWDGTQWVVDTNTHALPTSSDTTYIDDPAGTATLSGGSLTLGALNLATLDDGALLINGGSRLASGLTQIGSSTSSGVLTLDGSGTLWNSSSAITLDQGILNLSNGAIANIQSLSMPQTQVSQINIDGSGTRLSVSGDITSNLVDGPRVFNITNGASVFVSGSSLDSHFGIHIDGEGSRWSGSTPRNIPDFVMTNHATFASRGLTASQWDSPSTGRLLISGESVANVDFLRLMSWDTKTVGNIDGRNTRLNTDFLGLQTTNNSSHPGGAVLSITNGACVYGPTLVDLYGASVLNIGLDQNSKIILSGADRLVYSAGLIRFTVGTRVAIGQYEPIEYDRLSLGTTTYGSISTGEIRALGGVFDPTTHKVHVNYAKTANAGDTISFDLNEYQRVRFTDTGTGKTLGISFLGSDVSKTLTVSAELVADPASSGLTSILASGDNGSYIDAWAIHPTAGYTQGEDAYLSIEVGANYDIATFKVWHYDGSVWTNYAPDDLSYDGLYAGFTVNGFSSYALSGGPSMTAVPEPASLGLISLAGLGLLRRKRVA